MQIRCADCEGAGVVDLDEGFAFDCEACNGTGLVDDEA